MSDNLANSNVFLQREGTGAAKILGGAINPLQIRAQQKQSEQQQAARLAQQKAQRDKAQAELMQWAPEKAWEPFERQIFDHVRSLRDWEVNAYDQGVDLSDYRFQQEFRNKQDQINLLASKSNHLKSVYNDAQKMINDKNGYYNQGYYQEKLNDIFMDANGNGIPISEIDANSATQILNDPEGYNMDAIAKDFVAGLPEKIIADYQKRATGLGEYFNEQELKSRLYVRDGQGKIMFDKHGNPIMELTPEVIRASRQNPLINNYLKHYGGGDEAKEQQLLKQLLQPHDNTSFTQSPTGVTKYPTSSEGGTGGYSKPKKLIAVRYKTLRDAVYNHNASSLAQAFQGVKGIDIRFEGDDDQPGESKPDRIVITQTTKSRDRRGNVYEPQETVIPISTLDEMESALFKMNELIDEAQGSATMKIGADNIQLIHDEWKKNKKSTGVTFATPEKKTSTGVTWN